MGKTKASKGSSIVPHHLLLFGAGKSVKAVKNGILFNGGSPLEFASVKEDIINAFKSENVHSHIHFNDTDTELDIVEEAFTDIEPNLQVMVTQVMHMHGNSVQAMYMEGMNNLALAFPDATDNERIRRQLDLNNSRNNQMYLIQASQPTLEKNYRDALKNWIQEKDKFAEKRATLMKTFRRVFGNTPLSQIRDNLSVGLFRMAWYRLCTTLYDPRNMGQGNVSAIMTQLSSLPYDAAKTSLVALESDLTAIYTQLSSFGTTHITDPLKLHYLSVALTNSPGQEYATELAHVRMTGQDYEHARGIFHRRAAELSTAKDFSTITHNKVVNTMVHNNNNNSTRKGKKVKKCTVCGKNNHNVDRCFKTMTCDVCGQVGHISKYCTVNAGVSVSTVKPSGVNDRFTNNQTPKYPIFLDAANINDGESQEYYTKSENIYDNNNNTITINHMKDSVFVTVRVPDQYITIQLNVVLKSFCTGIYRDLCRIILDSGASAHMIPYIKLLCSHRSAQGQVILGNHEHKLPIEGMGNTNIEYIRDVMYVPGLTVGVFSVSVFDKMNCITVFSGGVGIVYDEHGNILLTSTLEDNGLYIVDVLYIQYMLGEKNTTFHCNTVIQSCHVTSSKECYTNGNKSSEPVETTSRMVNENLLEMTKCKIINAPKSDCTNCMMYEYKGRLDVRDQVVHTHIIVNPVYCFNGMSSDVGLNPLEILHKQWGHPGANNIKRALKDNIVEGCKYTYDDVKDLTMRVCFDCMQGRMKAKSSNPVTDHPWNPLEKISIDFKGYFSKRSLHGYRGFMLLSDYATNYLHVDLVKKKSEQLRVLKSYMTNVVRKYERTWRVMQCDSESIFKSESVIKWLRDHSIRLQLSTPYQHWQNGQVEVYVGIVMDKARTLMCCYNTPAKYWEYAVLYAVYVLNRYPTTDKCMSPYEAVTGVKPNVSMLVPFYAPGVYHLTKDERKEPWSPKAEACRMLGYADGYLNAYNILHVRTGRVIVRENCIFDTNISADDIADTDIDTTDDRDDSDYIEEAIQENGADSDIEEEVSDDIDRSDEYTDDTTTSEDTLYNDTQSELSNYYLWRSDILHSTQHTLALPPNPSSVDEALSGPDGEKWEEAIKKEVSQFEIRNTFGPAEQAGRGMKTKLILYYKYDGEYNIVCKARLVVCGYSQRKGIDYHDTYSPTTTNPIVFLLLHIAGCFRLHTATFDVSAAFLEGRADTKMYAWLPEELNLLRKKVRVEILGNWYGSKQAGKIWNDLFHSIVLLMNFTQCPSMPCLYLWINGDEKILLTVHVDDGLFVCTSIELSKEFMKVFLTHVRKAVMYDTVKLYLGMDISKNESGNVYEVSQQRYIEKEFSDHHHRTRTPMSVSTNLRVATPNTNNDTLLHDTGRYRYLADRTRPDILVAVGEVSTGGAEFPSDDHVCVSKRIKNYLTYTKELKMQLGGEGPVEMFAYCDASYITTGKCKSRLGGCIFLGLLAGAICSISQNDTVVSHSSTESEIKAIDLICKLIVYMRDILKFLGYEQTKPTRIYVDSKSAIELCRVLKVNHKARHINMRIQYIRELINARIIEIVFVPTEFNVADVLTKPLPRVLHIRHITILMKGHEGVDVSYMYPQQTYALYMESIIDDGIGEGDSGN